MINFSEADLLSVLPEYLEQVQTEALSAAVKEGLQKLQTYSRAASVYASIPDLPDEVLNLLAVELRTQYYNPEDRRDRREKMVEQTLAWYLRGGTGSVLTEYLGALYQGGRLEEWYHYDGNPYFFKAIVDLALDDEIETGTGEKITERIQAYKNVRSWLEELVFHIGVQVPVPIEYENKIRFFSEFYPRFNLAVLKLDGRWKLDGGRKLNGYDSSETLDFYPVAMSVSVPVAVPVQAELSYRHEMTAVEAVKAEVALKVQAGVSEVPETEQNIVLQMAASELVQAALSGSCFKMAAEEGVKVEAAQNIGIEAAESVKMEQKLTFQSEAGISVLQTTASMYRKNLLNGSWKLSGSRKLDGGRYAL